MKTCCGMDSVWVENVPGKGYYYCKECKNEVVSPIEVPDEDSIEHLFKNHFLLWDYIRPHALVYGRKE